MKELSLTSPPSCSNKTLSLYKLPIIFAAIMVSGAIFGFILHAGFYIATLSNLRLYHKLVALFNIPICDSIYYFIIALIMLIDQKMHRATIKNIVALLLISIVYFIITFFMGEGWWFLVQTAIDNQLFDFGEWFSFFINIVITIYGIIKLLILVGLFKLMAAIYPREPDSYLLPYAANGNLFAFLFTAILCFPSILLSFIINEVISFPLLNYFYSIPDLDYSAKSFVIFISIVPAIITLTIILLNLILCFFIARGCFVRKFDKIPLKLLFKSVGWSYLYLLLLSIIINIIQALIFIIIASSITRYNYHEMLPLLVITSLVLCIISIVSAVKLIRKAVRKYFSEQLLES